MWKWVTVDSKELPVGKIRRALVLFLPENKEEKITDRKDLVTLLMTLMHLSLFSVAGHGGH